MVKSDHLHIRINPTLKDRLKDAAAKENRTVSNYIENLLSAKLKEEIKMTKVINKNGHELDFNAAVDYMDDEIREALHSDMAPCGEQEFLSAYEKSPRSKI